MSVDEMSVVQMLLDDMSLDKMSVDQMTCSSLQRGFSFDTFCGHRGKLVSLEGNGSQVS